ncbi:MAG: PQQ-binding-like beta-propeller repeat protein [Gemmataceae bacterium]|nr:PQQ-binding-like beta-propeller repeat protein [Gemmataceae bacterium]
MRRSWSRVAFAGVLSAAVAGLVARGDRFVAGQPPAGPVPTKDKDKGKDKKDLPAEDLDSPFGFPYERDAKKQLEAARDYLTFKDIPWNTVSPLLQNILDSKSDSFFNVKYQVGGRTEVNRISVKTEANRIIAAFPKEGLEFYQQSYGQAAAALLDEAVKANADPAVLADLSQRYFHTRAGAEGTVLLGSLYLERGNYLEAAYAFERLLARPNADEFLTPRTLFKAALALKRSGDPRHADAAKAAADRLLIAAARDGLKVGRRTFTADQLRAELGRPVGAVVASSAVGEWTGRYGNAARNGTVSGGPPFLVPAFDPTPMLDPNLDTGQAAVNWIGTELGQVFAVPPPAAPKPLPLPGFFPVTTPDLVIYRGYGAVYAVAARDHVLRGRAVPAGEVRWAARTPFGLHQLQTPGLNFSGDTDVHKQVAAWWQTYKATRADSVLYENPLLGTLAHDGQTVYYLDDVAIPPPPVLQGPEFGAFPGGMPGGFVQHRGQLAEAVRAGELNAVDLATGNLVWTLGRFDRQSVKLAAPAQVAPPATEDDADKVTSAFHLCLNAVFLGPPLPLNGRLYVLIEQAGVIRLLCLDPKTLAEVKLLIEVEKDGAEPGKPPAKKRELEEVRRPVPTLVWQQKLGRPNNPFPADSVRRFQGAFLAAGEGVLVCPTNSGAVVGVDIMSRSLLWAHAYRKLDAGGPEGYPQQRMRGGMRVNPDGTVVPAQQLAASRWRAAAPIVAGGRVVLAAYDSTKLECLDIRTGKVLWAVDRKDADLYVGGVADGRVIVVGRTEVRAYPLAAAGEVQPDWTTDLHGATPTGHGVVGKGVIFLPVRPANAGKDGAPVAEIWAVESDKGKVVSRAAARNRSADPAGSHLAQYGLGNLVYQDGLVVAQSAWEVAVYPQLEVKRAEMDRRLAANPQDPAGLTDRGELLLDEGKVREAVADLREAGRHDPPETVRRRLRDKLYAGYTELARQDFAAVEPYLAEYAALCEVPADSDDPFEAKRRADQTLRRKQNYLYLLAKGREGQGRLAESFDACLALAALGDGAELFDLPDEPGVRTRGDVWARGRIDGMIHRAADPAARRALEDRVNKEWESVRAGSDPARLKDFVAVFGPYFPAGAAAGLRLAEVLLADGSDEAVRDAQTHLAYLRATAADPAVRARATEMLAGVMAKNGLLEDAVGLYQQLGREYADVPVRDGKTGADYLTDLLTDKRLRPYLEPARYPLPARVKVEDRQTPTAMATGTVGFEVEPDGELSPAFRRLRFTVDTFSSGNGTWTLRAVDRTTGAERCRFPDLLPLQTYNGTFATGRFVQGSGHLLLVHIGQWVHCLDLAEKRERWKENLLGPAAAGGPQPNPPGVSGDADEAVINYTDGTRITIGRSAVIQPGYVALLTKDGLKAYEPTTKRELWARRTVPDRCHLYGDARFLVLVERGVDTKPISTRVLRAVDGLPVEGAPDLGKELGRATSYRVFGKDALLTENTKDGGRVLRLLDLTTGKDAWRREFPFGSVPVRSADPGWAGFLTPAGELEVVEVRTGKPVANLKVDADKVAAHVKDCQEVKLFADPDRFYAVLDKEKAFGGGGGFRGNPQPFTLRTEAVNGPLYCFERATGKRLWYVDELFDKQRLVLDRFADLPVVIAAGPDKGGGSGYRVVVVEKDRGLVRFNKGLASDPNPFQALVVDPRAGTVDLVKHQHRVRIGPDDGKASR